MTADRAILFLSSVLFILSSIRSDNALFIFPYPFSYPSFLSHLVAYSCPMTPIGSFLYSVFLGGFFLHKIYSYTWHFDSVCVCMMWEFNQGGLGEASVLHRQSFCYFVQLRRIVCVDCVPSLRCLSSDVRTSPLTHWATKIWNLWERERERYCWTLGIVLWGGRSFYISVSFFLFL